MLATVDRSDDAGFVRRQGTNAPSIQAGMQAGAAQAGALVRTSPIGRGPSVVAVFGIVCFALAVVLALGVASGAQADSHGLPRTPAPEGASVYFISPTDGATVSSPITVRFGLVGMGVAPAGVEKPMTGHHHLLIDTDLPDASLPVPADDNHKHFGGGQTEVTIELPPGEHTLQLMLGDHLHIPHDPPIVSKRITIQVE